MKLKTGKQNQQTKSRLLIKIKKKKKKDKSLTRQTKSIQGISSHIEIFDL